MADTGISAHRSRRSLWLAQIIALGAIAVVVAVALLSSRSSGPADIEIADAWARATPESAATAAVYLRIGNGGGETDRLVSAATPAAGSVMIHSTAIAGDIVTMTHVEHGLPIAAGASVTLGPNGSHLMLMDLVGPLNEGETFPMTLTFETAGTVTTTVTVFGIGAMGPTTNGE